VYNIYINSKKYKPIKSVINTIKLIKVSNIPDNFLLHIDIGNKSLIEWVTDSKYIIFSELVRYSEKLIKNDLEYINAIMISNLSDNIVFVIKYEHVAKTLDKAMDYFLRIEEYEQCSKIRDLLILIRNKNKSIGSDERKLKKANSKN
jgi:hypothetical protein